MKVTVVAVNQVRVDATILRLEDSNFVAGQILGVPELDSFLVDLKVHVSQKCAAGGIAFVATIADVARTRGTLV